MGYILLVLLFGITAFWWYYFKLHYNKSGKLINIIPGPMKIPPFGNMFELHVSPGKYKIYVIEIHNIIYVL
jgi:hypothetical protein